MEHLRYQAFADNWTNTTSEFFEVDAQPVIAAMKLAVEKNITSKDDIDEDEERMQALAKQQISQVNFTGYLMLNYWLALVITS